MTSEQSEPFIGRGGFDKCLCIYYCSGLKMKKGVNDELKVSSLMPMKIVYRAK